MKKLAAMLVALVCAFSCVFGLAACGEGAPAISESEWGQSIEEFFHANGVTAEAQLFAAHYKDFKYEDGKYTAPEIPATGGFVCKNVVVTVDEDGKIVGVTYELRTEDLATPDRRVTVTKDGVERTDIPKPSDNTQMDEDEWKEQAAVFGTTSNYTLDRVRVSSGAPVAAMKLDGTTYYETWEGKERIWMIEDSAYILFDKTSANGQWTKTRTTQESYDDAIFDPSTMVTVAASAIEENFAALSFNAGIYTAAEIEIEYFFPFTLRDVEITVSGKRIVRVICTLVGGYDDEGDERITVDHIGSTEVTLPTDYTDNTASSGGKMDADAWTLCLQELVASTNYTQTAKNENVYDLYKVDGATDYREVFGTYYSGKVYTEDNGSYFFYSKEEADSLWTRETIEEAEYRDNFKSNSLLGDAAAILLRDYEKFDYNEDEDIYTLAQAEYSSSTNVENIQVTVFKGKIVRISFYVFYYGDVVIDEFGTTEIELPAVNPGSVSGKTFEFFMMSGNGVNAEELDAMNEANRGLEVVFNADGTVKVTANHGTVIEEGTYTQSGGTVSINFTKITQDGVVQDVNISGKMTYDGWKLIQVLQMQQQQPPQTYYIVYTERA